MKSRRFKRTMYNMFRWGWQSGISGSDYRAISLIYRRRHHLAFNLGKFFGKRWNY